MGTLKRHNAKRDANEPAIVAALARCGWFVQRISIKDFPDLLIAKGGRMHLVEVKVPKGVLLQGQSEKARELACFGVTVIVARTVADLLRSLGEVGPR